MSSDIVISVKNISKCYLMYDRPQDRLKQSIFRRRRYYREFWALKDVSFEVKKGETVGIIGRNGSGKSTLLQIIAGTLTPTSGEIQVNGRVAALLELGSGFNPEFTGRENVYMNGAVIGLSKEEIDARFDDIAAFADIGEFIDQPVKTYSSGMYVRLAFAVAINVDPEILIVDEALSVGDELFQRKCFSRIEAIRSSGTTILFVSHSGSTIVELCNRAILLDTGEKLAVGVPKQIVGRYQKLLYAPVDKQEAIRDQIRRMDEQPVILGGSVVEVPLGYNAITSEDRESLKESFDPYLKPSSTLVYESRGVLIETPQILTLSGEPVNGLISGKKYRYCYKVFFEETVEKIRFGMLIKTTSGLEIGGAISAATIAEAIPIVELGQCLYVEFVFNCYLNPGLYFLNAGVLGVYNQEEVFLHRSIDIAAFRVLPINNNTSTEIINFGCYSIITLSE